MAKHKVQVRQLSLITEEKHSARGRVRTDLMGLGSPTLSESHLERSIEEFNSDNKKQFEEINADLDFSRAANDITVNSAKPPVAPPSAIKASSSEIKMPYSIPQTANDDVEHSTSVLSNKSILKNVRRNSIIGGGPRKKISFNDYSFLKDPIQPPT